VEVVRVENLVKRYGSKTALENVSFAIEKPMLCSLLGPNGAGKSTLLSILAGVLKPTSGVVLVKGLEPWDRRVKKLVGYMPQDYGLYSKLSGWDNIAFYARLSGIPLSEARARAAELADLLGLREHLRELVGKYSGGMKRKLSLIIALLHNPEILLLDEPTTGLDPGVRRDVWSILEKLRREGRTVIFATHYAEEADRLSDHVIVIDQGRVVAEGSPQELKEKYGPKATVYLEFDREPAPELVSEIRSAFGSCVAGSNTLRVLADNPDEAVPKLIGKLYDSGYRVLSLRVVKPTLEDVFFKLTGRRIDQL